MLGISSWTYGWAVGVNGYPAPDRPLTAIGLLERARAFGVPLMQFADNLPLDRLSEDELACLRQRAQEWHIAIELGTRGFEPARLLRYLELARYFDAKIVRIVPHGTDGEPNLREIESRLRELLPEYRAAGVVIAIENYERHSAACLAALVDRLDSEWVGVCLDTVNSMGALETPKEVVRTLGPYVVNLHIKDFRIERVPSKMGYVVRGCVAGEGRLDVPWLLRELERYGRRPNRILELWTPYQQSVAETIALEEEWARRSIRYLQQLA